MGLESIEAVEAWAEINGGEEGLKIAIAAGRFGNDRRTHANATAWLDQKEAERAKVRDSAQDALRLREVTAAEVSARASSDSAVAAATSARSAIAAAIFAFFALLVSVAAYFKSA